MAQAAELADYEARLAETLDELRATRAKLAAAQKLEALSQLAAGISHEVNTPAQYLTDNLSFLQRAFDKLLALVHAQSELIEAVRNAEPTALALEAADNARRDVKLDYLARQVPRAIEQSLKGLEDIGSIVKAMKEFSRPNGPETQPSDVHDLIQCVAVITRSEWRYVAELELDFDWNLPPLPLRRDDFAQAMLALIVAAARAIARALPQASSHKERIVIATELSENEARIRVSHSARCGTDPTWPSDALSFVRSVVVDHHHGSLELDAPAATSCVLRLPLGRS